MKEFFIDSDGIQLHAKLDRPDESKKGPLCILVHGFTGHMEEDHILAAQRAMNDAGVSVLRVEMYGHGKSGGRFRDHTLYKWVTNALAVVEYARTLDFVTELYMCGHSQGGLLTMLIGGMCPDDFNAVLPLSPAWMIPENAREGTVLGTEFDPEHIPEKIIRGDRELSGDYIRTAQTVHVEDAIARYKGRVLIVHGDRDDIVPYSYAEKAAELYRDAELVTVHGADHCFTGHTKELADAIRAFFSAGCGNRHGSAEAQFTDKAVRDALIRKCAEHYHKAVDGTAHEEGDCCGTPPESIVIACGRSQEKDEWKPLAVKEEVFRYSSRGLQQVSPETVPDHTENGMYYKEAYAELSLHENGSACIMIQFGKRYARCYRYDIAGERDNTELINEELIWVS